MRRFNSLLYIHQALGNEQLKSTIVIIIYASKMLRNEIRFWLLFLFLNFLLFLPGFLVNAGTSSFLPLNGFLHGSMYERVKTIFVRSNYDIFRLSVDLFLISFIYYLLRKHIRPALYGWLAGIYYILAFAYITYYVTFEKVYLIPPVIYNDISLLKLGFVNIMDGKWLKAAAIILLVLSLSFGLIWLVRQMIKALHSITWSRFSKAAIMILAILILINTLKSGFTYTSNQAFQETFALIGSNIKSSADARKNLMHFNVDRINSHMNYQQVSLKSKPDIYLFFVESYGKLLYESRALRVPYLRCMDSCESVLHQSGMKVATGFSTSPVSGGQSWVSYTTVMFGYNIRNQGTFNSLLKNPAMAHYDNLFRVLKQKGYRTYRLNAMPQESNLEVPWETYSRFYSIDKWINFPDLKYTGRLYGFGPSPPDQYSLNFAGRYINKNSPGPRALFFITQTTHNPFYSPDSLARDWQSLNGDTDRISFHASVFLKNPRITDYAKAVHYDVSALLQFITQVPDSNSIFILIGDHQPPVITSADDGFETPVHIICRNKEFISSFMQFGFREGMIADEKAVPIRHEGIYSMFMREFVRFYGTDHSQLPAYRPFGIILNEI
jgi:hypothetical protein